jgi:hypothetical protein
MADDGRTALGCRGKVATNSSYQSPRCIAKAGEQTLGPTGGGDCMAGIPANPAKMALA